MYRLPGSVHSLADKKRLAQRRAAAQENIAASVEQHRQELQKQRDQFAEDLRKFAEKYREKIQKDSQFRAQFYEMCRDLGVDPLQSSKGFFAKAFGSTQNKYYYDLGVQIIDICASTAQINGGIIAVSDLQKRLVRLRGKDDFTESDIKQAVAVLKPLRSCYEFSGSQGALYLRSVPGEISPDQLTLLTLIRANKGIGMSCMEICKRTGWDTLRTMSVIDVFMKEGQCMVDDGSGGERLFWLPAVEQS